MDAGNERLALIRGSLDGFDGFPRNEAQRQTHELFLRSLLPVIYGTPCFDEHRQRILRENGIERMPIGALVSTHRCFGKTTMVSMFCAAILAHVPEATISVFCTGQRSARSVMQKTAGFLSMLDQEDMHRMGAYSAADAKDARGKIIIMEEASRIDDALIKEVILPLAAKGALLGIGTPLNEKTLFSTMLDDTKTFDVLEVTLDSMRVRHV